MPTLYLATRVSLSFIVWFVIAVAIVFLDETLPGIMEKLMVLAMLSAFISSCVHYGLASLFSLGFLLFLFWYLGGGLASYIWLKERSEILTSQGDNPTVSN